jgi:hypothetical protein
VRFELTAADNDHVRLHEYLDKLADSNQASAWIRETLIAALPSQPSGSKVEVKQFKTLPKNRSFPGQAGGFGDWPDELDDETSYEDIDA